MAPQSKGSGLQIFYSAALTILIGLSSWIGINIIDLKVEVARLTAERNGDHEATEKDHAEISVMRMTLFSHDDKNKEQDKEIQYLKEAILPDAPRRKSSPF